MQASHGGKERRSLQARRFSRQTILLATSSLWLMEMARCGLFFGATLPPAEAQEAEAPRAQVAEMPVGQFLTVGSPIDDLQFGRVKNAALALQNEAAKTRKKAVLVLEVSPGSSQFHQVQGLARFLSSGELSDAVKTVAWIPESVTGNNVLLALACHEIIMHPDAELGDLGRGKALDADEQQQVLNIVEKRRNPKVNQSLALGLMDPQLKISRIRVGLGDGGPGETQVVTDAELKEKLDNKVRIDDVQVIKEAGQIGKFTGVRARNFDILAMQTAQFRRDIVEIYNLPDEAMQERAKGGDAPRAALIRFDEPLMDPLFIHFIERQIQRSVDQGSNLIILEITSPGGRLDYSEQIAFMVAELDQRKVRTVAYVPKAAISGAALVAMACDEIYLHPTAKMGDIGMIQAGGPNAEWQFAPEKRLSPLRAELRDLAVKKGRSPSLAEAMCDKDLLVYEVTHARSGRRDFKTQTEIDESGGDWIKGPLVHESRAGNFLTVTGQRAFELRLAESPVADMDELKVRLGIPAATKLEPVERTWVDTTVFVLNNGFVTGFLLFLSILLIYLELHFMTGLLGIGSALCFSLFFWSRFLGGTADWLEVVLFVLGFACIAMEVFVIPGFGVFGVSGGLLVAASLVMASQTFTGFDTGSDMTGLVNSVGTLAGSIFAVIVVAMLISRYLPHIPGLNSIILAPPGLEQFEEPGSPRLRPDLVQSNELAALIGERGKAMSVLRPAGKARIAGRYLDVVSDGPYLLEGSDIEVVQVAGNRIVVRQV